MGEICKFPEKDENEELLVCCSECDNEAFLAIIHNKTLYFICTECEEVYEVADLQEATVH